MIRALNIYIYIIVTFLFNQYQNLETNSIRIDDG